MKAKTQRIAEHQERLEHWQSLTPIEQLMILNRRLGIDVGAVRQRAMIDKRIADKKGQK